MHSRTHEVINQPPPLIGYNLFTTDPALREAVERECAGWAMPRLTGFGSILGTGELIRCGFQANENPPVLETHDRFGNRRDEVEFHPAWHELMRLSISNGLHSLPWSEPRKGAHVARAASMLLAGQNEAGHMCPVSMTYSSVPVLRLERDLAAEWEPSVLSATYDPRFLPRAEKDGALIGMAMTEKQGGSDVRANTTRAGNVAGPEYTITGHKWFCSAPMCDAFLVLAQAPGGLTCFFLPRWTPDGARNGFHIQRLKRKLGNRSNASCEVEFDGAWARRIGEEGRGVPAIMEMVQHTRLDCCIGAIAIMRRALVEALHHARHRSAFGRPLWDQPLMRQVLADLAIESETATLMTMRLARAFDRRSSDGGEHAFARLATAVAKYWLSKRAAPFIGEALECLGGSGYVEESILPRLYREAPLNSIWEGSGNVICLDVLRVIRREPECIDAFLAELRGAKGADAGFDGELRELETALSSRPEESDARRLTERMAVLLGASLVVRSSPQAVADAMCSSRLGHGAGRTFGTLGKGVDTSAILERAWPN
jgi:putative acyl-CoA dehydrogenase